MKQLTDVILQRVLAATGASAVQHIALIARLWSGYGEILRLQLRGGSQASVIVKLVQPPAADATRSHARKLRSYDVELAFYAHYAKRCVEARVARAFLCERLGDGWLFVLEDLDAAGLRERRADLPVQHARACLDWLASFHATFVGSAAPELWSSGTYWHLATRPDELARSCDPLLRSAAGQLDARLRAATHKTLVHGDAKVENFCFARDLTAVAAVDFQYVGRGCGVQDVSYLLSCMDSQACEAHAPALLEHYFTALRRALATQRPDMDDRTHSALEAEWRALYAVAWADFYRFLSGWAPEQYTCTGYAAHMIALALA